MLAVGHQVQVVGELHALGDLLEDVNAEALTAAFDVDPRGNRRVAKGTGLEEGRGREREREKEG